MKKRIAEVRSDVEPAANRVKREPESPNKEINMEPEDELRAEPPRPQEDALARAVGELRAVQELSMPPPLMPPPWQ